MSAAAILHRLHDAGVEVVYEAPDQIRLRGPVTDELVKIARAAKPELLTLVRPRPQVSSCGCCGRFHFSEPAVVCFWCRPENTMTKLTQTPASGDSVNSVTVNSGAREKRECLSCGGGMQPTDPDGGHCFTCRSAAGKEG